MRISDWSSDVCSSDLFAAWTIGVAPRRQPAIYHVRAPNAQEMLSGCTIRTRRRAHVARADRPAFLTTRPPGLALGYSSWAGRSTTTLPRLDQRCVGEGCVSTFIFCGSQHNQKKSTFRITTAQFFY